jgi:hypothetical protein
MGFRYSRETLPIPTPHVNKLPVLMAVSKQIAGYMVGMGRGREGRFITKRCLHVQATKTFQ